MKFKFISALLLCMLSITSCSTDESATEDVTMNFLEKLYTCNFEGAMSLCTDAGSKDLTWFSSNLTEDDLKLITEYPVIEIKHTHVDDTLATIKYHVSNAIVCDSLEKPGYIGEKDASVQLIKQGDKWLVNHLEW